MTMSCLSFYLFISLLHLILSLFSFSCLRSFGCFLLFVQTKFTGGIELLFSSTRRRNKQEPGVSETMDCSWKSAKEKVVALLVHSASGYHVFLQGMMSGVCVCLTEVAAAVKHVLLHV
jgi:hypothetical protein